MRNLTVELNLGDIMRLKLFRKLKVDSRYVLIVDKKIMGVINFATRLNKDRTKGCGEWGVNPF